MLTLCQHGQRLRQHCVSIAVDYAAMLSAWSTTTLTHRKLFDLEKSKKVTKNAGLGIRSVDFRVNRSFFVQK